MKQQQNDGRKDKKTTPKQNKTTQNKASLPDMCSPYINAISFVTFAVVMNDYFVIIAK